MRKQCVFGSVLATTIVFLRVGATTAQCPPEWVPVPEVLGKVHALARLTTNEGTFLYAGGAIDGVGELKLNGVARWDGQKWAPVGPGLPGDIWSLAVFDDGTGDAVYAGSPSPSPGTQRWDGKTWSAAGSNGQSVHPIVLRVHDLDGPGPGEPELVAGGGFTLNSGNSLAVLKAGRWVGVPGLAANALVYATADYESLRAPVLVVAGQFKNAGGVTVNNIASWDGTAWSPLGPGVINTHVSALAVFDEDGPGPNQPTLFAGGSFTQLGDGTPMNKLARWNGATWSSVGGGVNGNVYDFTLSSNPLEPSLIATGNFKQAGGQLVNRVARWDGQAWSALGSGLEPDPQATLGTGGFTVLSLLGPKGEEVFVGGAILKSGDTAVQNLARWAPCDAVCRGDCTGEGTLNINDFVCFQTKFAVGDGAADCDSDDVHTIDDFVCFQSAFASGC
jgi:trimeric autotransporter adhesin